MRDFRSAKRRKEETIHSVDGKEWQRKGKEEKDRKTKLHKRRLLLRIS